MVGVTLPATPPVRSAKSRHFSIDEMDIEVTRRKSKVESQKQKSKAQRLIFLLSFFGFLLVHVVDSEESAGEGESFAVGYEERGVNGSGGRECDACHEQGASEDAHCRSEAKLQKRFFHLSFDIGHHECPIKKKKTKINPLSALEAVLLVQTATKTCLQASLQTVFIITLLLCELKHSKR